MQQYFSVLDFLKSTGLPPYNNVLVGKTNTSLLIGPTITKTTCWRCLQKRLLSSIFADKNIYLELTGHDVDRLDSIITTISDKIRSRIYEYPFIELNRPIIHHILAVPKCRHCHVPPHTILTPITLFK